MTEIHALCEKKLMLIYGSQTILSLKHLTNFCVVCQNVVATCFWVSKQMGFFIKFLRLHDVKNSSKYVLAISELKSLTTIKFSYLGA